MDSSSSSSTSSSKAGCFAEMLKQIAASAAIETREKETMATTTPVLKERCQDFYRKLNNLESRIRNIKKLKSQEVENGGVKGEFLRNLPTPPEKRPTESATPSPSNIFEKQPTMHTLPEDAKYFCDICGTNEHKAYQFNEHVIIHHTDRSVWKCLWCTQKFGRRSGLRRHIKMIHMRCVHKCPIENCKHPGYKCVKALSTHIRTVHKKDPNDISKDVEIFNCDRCGGEFSDILKIVGHRCKQKKYRCICGKLLIGEMIQNHRETCEMYSGKKSTCDICGANFSDAKQVEEHLHIHEGQGLIKCACGLIDNDSMIQAHQETCELKNSVDGTQEMIIDN